MTNAQMALVCAVEATSSYGSRQNGDAHTDRIVKRAHHFLAFLAENNDQPAEVSDAMGRLLAIHRPSTDHGPGREPYCVGSRRRGRSTALPVPDRAIRRAMARTHHHRGETLNTEAQQILVTVVFSAFMLTLNVLAADRWIKWVSIVLLFASIGLAASLIWGWVF
jgi:hypothetical protein